MWPIFHNFVNSLKVTELYPLNGSTIRRQTTSQRYRNILGKEFGPKREENKKLSQIKLYLRKGRQDWYKELAFHTLFWFNYHHFNSWLYTFNIFLNYFRLSADSNFVLIREQSQYSTDRLDWQNKTEQNNTNKNPMTNSSHALGLCVTRQNKRSEVRF